MLNNAKKFYAGGTGGNFDEGPSKKSQKAKGAPKSEAKPSPKYNEGYARMKEAVMGYSNEGLKGQKKSYEESLSDWQSNYDRMKRVGSSDAQLKKAVEEKEFMTGALKAVEETMKEKGIGNAQSAEAAQKKAQSMLDQPSDPTDKPEQKKNEIAEHSAPKSEAKPKYQISEKANGKFYATGMELPDGSDLHLGPFGSEKEVHEAMGKFLESKWYKGPSENSKKDTEDAAPLTRDTKIKLSQIKK